MSDSLLTCYQAYIFDFDGTLSDSADDVVASMHQAFIACGLPDRDISPLTIGPPVEYMFQTLAPECDAATIDLLVTRFRAHYNAAGMPRTTLFAGIPAVLDRLTARRVPLFVATNKSQVSVLPLLERLGVRHLFRDVLCCDSQLKTSGVMLTKADMIRSILENYTLDPRQTVMIGDSLHDIEGARAAGVHTAGVLYGYSPHGALAAAQPEHLIPDADWRTELS